MCGVGHPSTFGGRDVEGEAGVEGARHHVDPVRHQHRVDAMLERGGGGQKMVRGEGGGGESSFNTRCFAVEWEKGGWGRGGGGGDGLMISTKCCQVDICTEGSLAASEDFERVTPIRYTYEMKDLVYREN